MAKKTKKAGKKGYSAMTSPSMTSVKSGKVSMKAGTAAAKAAPEKMTMNKAKMSGGLKGGRGE